MSKFRYTDQDTGESIIYEAADDSSYQELQDLGQEAIRTKGKDAIEKQKYEDTKDDPVRTQPRELSDELIDAAKGVGSAALGGLSYALDKSDQYAQAPPKAALMSFVKDAKAGGDWDAAMEVLPRASRAFKNQWGQPTSEAPSGKQIAQELGLGETALSEAFPSAYSDTGDEWFKLKKGGFLDPTASGAVGGAIDMGSDLTNYIGAGAIKKGVSLGKKGVASIGHAFSGMPQKDILTYLTRNKAVRARIAKYGADTATHADDVKNSMIGKIWDKKKVLGTQIETAIGESKGITGSLSPIIDSLQTSLDKLHPVMNGPERDEIASLISMIKKVGEQSSHYVPSIPTSRTVELSDLNAIKVKLQEMATTAYIKPGAIGASPRATKLAFAAKDAAAKTRIEMSRVIKDKADALKAVIAIAPDDASKAYFTKSLENLTGLEAANRQLSKLHAMEGRYSGNLLKPGTSPEQLLLAGSGRSPRGEAALKHLGQFADDKNPGEFLQKASDFSSATSIKNAPILPVDTTGKSYARMAATSSVASLPLIAAFGPVVGAALGAAVGTVATSPKTTRAAANLTLAAEKYGKPLKYTARVNKSSEDQRGQKPEDLIAQLSQDSSTSQAAETLRVALQKGQKSYAAALYLLGQTNQKVREASQK